MPAPIAPGDDLHRVQIKVPRKLYDQLVSCLREGETISILTRELWTREVAHRAIELIEQRALEEKQRERRKRSKPPAPQ